ncbi:MAG: hypothetical protein R3F62_10670 [Planctomycetota bacterium]
MSDEGLRELERRWRQSGADEDGAAWFGARLRAGELSSCELRLQASLGDSAARLAYGRDPQLDDAHASAAEEALARLRQAGGMLHHELWEPAGLEGAAGHELVARATAAAFCHPGPGPSLAQDPSYAGEPIEVAAFYGERYDAVSHELRFYTPQGLLPAAEADAVFADHVGSWGWTPLPGYAECFCSPPHGLSLRRAQVTRLFAEVNACLWGASGPREVYAWATPWRDTTSGGSYLWSVRPHAEDQAWVGVAYAADD